MIAHPTVQRNKPTVSVRTLTTASEVAVIGGGPAGASAALALARAGCPVTLIERDASPELRVGETVPPAIQQALEQLGVWREFLADGHTASTGNCSVWGSAQAQERDFIFSPYGRGWHLNRQRFDQMLRVAAVRAGAQLITSAHLQLATPTANGRWHLALTSCGASSAPDISLTANFVVDASGRGAHFARQLGAKRRTFDRLLGFAVYLESALPSLFTLVEATRDGWWYSAALPDGRQIVTFMTDSDLPAARQARTLTGWRQLLQQTEQTSARCAHAAAQTQITPRIVPAQSSCLSVAASTNWLAIGDAVATYDPLSSQGISVALAHGLAAASLIPSRFAGQYQLLTTHTQQLSQRYAQYLTQRRTYYALERRWPTAPFWSRRQPRIQPSQENDHA